MGYPDPEVSGGMPAGKKERSISEFVIADSNGESLSYSQFARLWNYIKVCSTAERTLTRYVNGQAIKKKFKPQLAFSLFGTSFTPSF